MLCYNNAMYEFIENLFTVKTKAGLKAGFVFVSYLAGLGMSTAISRTFSEMPMPVYAPFTIGTELLALFICVIIYYSCMRESDQVEEHTARFAILLSTTAFGAFLDQIAWTMVGLPWLNSVARIADALLIANSYIIVFMFWRYVADALEMEPRYTRIIDRIFETLLVPAIILALLNIFYPIYFSIDSAGIYHREAFLPLSSVHAVLIIIAFLIGLTKSTASAKGKLTAATFLIPPFIGTIVSLYAYGISTEYSASILSITLMYGVLVADRTQKMHATRQELQMAAEIQVSALPASFPAFPDRMEFDLYASMDPAREVGGDFYNFFLIDEDHLCVYIADVSGKGVPAALFMMSSMSILNANSVSGKTPGRILADTNDLICASDHNDMFVTVWLGILEISTGRFTYANAGHEKPAFAKAGKGFELLSGKHGFVIGGMEGMVYREEELLMEPGSRIFVYTDGVPEANNPEEELFGTDRMVDALNRELQASPQQLLINVRGAVDKFAGAAEQFDDLTMLCLEYKGGN